MKKNKRYITQLSQNDLNEIADVVNIQADEGIVITRTETGLKIGVDKQCLRFWMQTDPTKW